MLGLFKHRIRRARRVTAALLLALALAQLSHTTASGAEAPKKQQELQLSLGKGATGFYKKDEASKDLFLYVTGPFELVFSKTKITALDLRFNIDKNAGVFSKQVRLIDSEKDIDLACDRMEFDAAKRTFTALGSVKVKNKDLNAQSDQMLVLKRSDIGTKLPEALRGDQALISALEKYQPSDELIVFTGNVQIRYVTETKRPLDYKGTYFVVNNKTRDAFFGPSEIKTTVDSDE